MHSVFSRLADFDQDVSRNIVSTSQNQSLFDDLTEDPAEQSLADRVEAHATPGAMHPTGDVIHRPFEDARWSNAIAWPFENRHASRYSDGTYGVWYGSESVETTVYESVYHWYKGLLSDAEFTGHSVVAERQVYAVHCNAALIDLRDVVDEHPNLLHPTDYTWCQSIGARIHREGHPGLVTLSVRRPVGHNVAIFTPNVLSQPRLISALTYRLDSDRVTVETAPGIPWMTLKAPA